MAHFALILLSVSLYKFLTLHIHFKLTVSVEVVIIYLLFANTLVIFSTIAANLL